MQDLKLAAFNSHILPMQRAPGTSGKYLMHCLAILTWAVSLSQWKGMLPRLQPINNDVLGAFLWDLLAFKASLFVLRGLRQAMNAVLKWHDRLHLDQPSRSFRQAGVQVSHPHNSTASPTSKASSAGVQRRTSKASKASSPSMPVYHEASADPQALCPSCMPLCVWWLCRVHVSPPCAAQLPGRGHLNCHMLLVHLDIGGRLTGLHTTLQPLEKVRRCIFNFDDIQL
jgi:hypothetical protein